LLWGYGFYISGLAAITPNRHDAPRRPPRRHRAPRDAYAARTLVRRSGTVLHHRRAGVVALARAPNDGPISVDASGKWDPPNEAMLIDSLPMNGDMDHVTALLPDVEILEVERLRDGGRSTVDRVTVRGYERSTLIAKRYHDPCSNWIRESAALSMVGDDLTAPRVIAAGERTVLMSDLGGGHSVADSLMGTDAEAATADVMRWVAAVAAIHRNTAGRRDAFVAGLAGPDTIAVSPHAESARDLASLSGALGVTDDHGGLDEAAEAINRLDVDTRDTHALTPADACPDNNVMVGDRLALIDFEGAQWRHLAWDVAYLRVPWPTCWCSWSIPDDLAAAAITRYRDLAAPAFPYVATPDFERDVEVAAVLWCLMSVSWYLAEALKNDTTLGDGPRRRGIIQQRLRICAGQSHLPRIASFAKHLHEASIAAWGSHEVLLARAFRSR